MDSRGESKDILSSTATFIKETKEMPSTSFVTSAQRESAQRFLAKIKPFIRPSTDPDVIKRILRETKLDHFVPRDDHFSAYISEITRNPQDMTAFLAHMEQHLVNQDMICSLLALIEDKHFISTEELKQAAATFQLQINLLCLFEAFTFSMGNSPTLAEDVLTHIHTRRNCAYPGSPIYSFFCGVPSSTSPFLRLKIPSIDPAMSSIARYKLLAGQKDSREMADAFVDRHHLKDLNRICSAIFDPTISKSDNVAGMSLNILEAGWQDTTNTFSTLTGGIDNAQAGCALIGISEELNRTTGLTLKTAITPKDAITTEDGSYSLLPGLKVNKENPMYLSEFRVPPEWVDLYNSWNLHFVIRTFGTSFLPLKLLLPSVFSADAYAFKEARIASLFLFANILANERTYSNPYFATHFNFTHANSILTEWGRINNQYSHYAIQKLCPTLDTTPEKLHHDIFGSHATARLGMNLLQFFQDGNGYRCTANIRPQKKGTLVVREEKRQDSLAEEIKHQPVRVECGLKRGCCLIQ